MSLITCSECGENISDQAAACPHCGVPLKPVPVNIVQAAPKKKRSGCLVGCAVLILLILVGIAVGTINSALEGSEAAKERQQNQERMDADREARKQAAETFRANVEQHYAQLLELDAGGDSKAAFAKIQEFHRAGVKEHQDLASLAIKHEELLLLQEFKAITSRDTDAIKQGHRIFARLAELRPDNHTYTQRRDAFADEVAKIQAAADAEAAAAAAKAKRKELIESQFSDWDGSHPALTRFIKQSMNDPKSYQHVETRFADRGDHIFVITQFRGKNAFGGLVLNAISAKVDFKGNVIEVIDSE